MWATLPTLTSAATQSPPRRISPFWQSDEVSRDAEVFSAFVTALELALDALPPPTCNLMYQYRGEREEREERTFAFRTPGTSRPRIPPTEGNTSALIPLLSIEA